MRKLLGFVTFFILFCPRPVESQQSIIFVSRTDPACGGQAPCYTTIQDAVDVAQPGDIVRIQTGTYPEQVAIEKNKFPNATEFDRIVIEADPALPPGQVVLTGAPGPQCTEKWAIRFKQSKFVTLRGLTITGTGAQAISMMGGNNANQDIHIELNRIFGNGSSSCNGGITIARGNPGTMIVNNLIYSNGRNGIAFEDAEGGPHYIINDTIYGNQWNGIDVTRNHVVTIANNIINKNGTASGSTGGRFGVKRESSNSPQPAGIKLRNNLVCGNTLGEINGPVLDTTDSGNFTPQGTEGVGVAALPGCNVASNLFVNLNGPDNLPNSEDDDFSLRVNSFAIDVGIDPRTLGFNPTFNPIFEADFAIEGIRPADGNADRVASFDAGAFEFPNAPPLAHAGANRTVFGGQLVTLDGSQSSDPEGATLAYQWTIIAQPGGNANLSGATTVRPTFTPLSLGEYVFQLVVNDGQLYSTPSTVTITVIHVNHAPTANAGGPYVGNVGVPIQFSGSGTDPDGDGVTFNWNFDDGGAATGATPTHVYGTAGTFGVTLTVTDALGATAVSQTTATIAVGGLVLNPIGNKTVNLGQTLKFTVSATNSSGGPVSLFVSPLPLPNHANFTSATGVFTFTPDMLQVGSYQLTFTALSGQISTSETITITVPNPPPGGTTAVRGKVYNLNQSPLGNVKVTLKATGQTGFSANNGYFTITGIPSGKQQLIVNGREAHLGVFAILAVSVNLIDGVLNELGSPITLPDVDVESEVQVSSNFNTVVTNSNLPGVELTILAGSARNADGTPFNGKLSVNPVPDYGRPESRPEELRPGMAITIQPAGIRFNPPARLTFPNADGMLPGNELNLWSLSPDTGTFNIVGKTAISADGQSIITVEGGVTASAWHFPLASSPVPTPNQGSNFCGSCRTAVGSEANLEEGSLYITHNLPSYRSLSQNRSLSLTYSSITADPRPIITLDTTLNVRAAVPNSYSTRLVVGGVQQGGEVFTDARSLPEDADSISRLSIQFDASNLVSGRYPYQATVFSNYLNSSIGGIASGNVIVVNRKSSPMGAGWAVTGLQQLHPQADGTLLLTSGDGTALFFSGGPDTFTSPPRDFSMLIKNPDGTFTRTFKDGTRANFNSQGHQTSVVDRSGNTTNYSYDAGNRLTAVTDPAGLVTALVYAGAKLQRITDPSGRQTQFQYDSSGYLIRTTHPDGSFVSYGYDDKGHVIQGTDERGNSTTYLYDFAGRFSQSTRPTGETRSLTSSKIRGLADIANGQGTPTHPAPIVLSQNAAATLTDGKGNPSRFTLDSLGQIVAQTDALGHTTATQRDANGNPTRITRSNGAITTMTYDAKGNLLSSTDPLGATTTFTYEPSFNQVRTIRDPKGNTTTINYDEKGNPVEIIDALGNRTQVSYDIRGLVTSITSAFGTPIQTTTSFTYDGKGNLVTTTNPKGDVTALAYDNAGNVLKSTDGENRATEFVYDPMNRLISVLDAALKITQYSYDPKGNLTQVRDAKNQTTTFAYDGLDRLTSATNPLGLSESFVYDTNGNLTSTTNRNGETVTLDYDALNRLISKTRPATSSEVGAQVTMFSYDSVGNLTTVTNPVVAVVNQYDLANRLLSSTSGTEATLAETVVPINTDTLIDANNRQFDGRTIQVSGKTLTIDGSHTFANLVLLNGAILTQSGTTSSTVKKLDILVTGTLQIDATSRIDVTGRGFLGGGQPGNPSPTNGMTLGFQAVNGSGNGASYGGLGGVFNGNTNSLYGDFRNPNDVGSGGGAFSGNQGGNGGGQVRIVAQTIALDGAIRANGGPANGAGAGGSGGGIRIDVGTLSGTGSMSVNGSAALSSGGGGGGGGRVAVYYQNATTFNFGNVSAFGATFGGGSTNGGAGTVYLQGSGRENGELIVDNNNLVAVATPILPQASGLLALSNLRVRRTTNVKIDDQINLAANLEVSGSSTLTLTKPLTAASVAVTNNAVITHEPTTAAAAFKLDFTVNSLAIDTTSRIDVTGRGFLGGGQPGNPSPTNGMTLGFQAVNGSGNGASYGGLGGGNTNPAYGDFKNPNDIGSGGGSFSGGRAGNGGGLVRIVAQTIALDGAIRANGGPASGAGAGGSGGGIRIDVGTLSGTGSISVNGSAALSSGGGGGGGGRVAVYYQNATTFNFGNVSAFGATFGGGSTNGGAGTVYLQGSGRERGELIVDNNNLIAPNETTPVFAIPAASLNFTAVKIRRGAKAKVDSLLNVVNDIQIVTDSRLLALNQLFASTIQLTTRSTLESIEVNASTSLQLADNSVVTHPPTTASVLRKLLLNVNSLTIDATSRMDVTGRGFLGGGQPGNPSNTTGMTQGFQLGSGSGAGGSYGGLGGGASNPVYGDLRNPNDVGSGGGGFNGADAGNGGGLIRIVAQTLVLNGAIWANGGPPAGGGSAAGGSGGGIRIDVGTLSGTGSMSANGSAATLSGGGGGGGGRIALYYADVTAFSLVTQVTATGGIGSGAPNGQSGTIHTEQQLALLAPTVEQPPVMKAEATRLIDRSHVHWRPPATKNGCSRLRTWAARLEIRNSCEPLSRHAAPLLHPYSPIQNWTIWIPSIRMT